MSDMNKLDINPENPKVPKDVQNTNIGNFANIVDKNALQNKKSVQIKRPTPTNANSPEWAEDLMNILQRLSETMKNSSDESTEPSQTETESEEGFIRKSRKKVNIRKSELPIDPNANKKVDAKKKLEFDRSVRKTAESISSIPGRIATKLHEIQINSKKQELLTRSHYNGVWREALQCMDGYGTYTYPDGSEYKGYFSNGHFNGYGTLHLGSPYNCTYKGTFIDGLISEIEDMWFDDGLHVDATFDGFSGDFSKWKYCSPKDRRYAVEQVNGLPAVGPHSYLTTEKPTRGIAPTFYDLLHMGVFNPSTGVVINRPKPLTNMYVPCRNEVEWIKENCRKGDHLPQKTTTELCEKIIANNLRNEIALEEYDPNCNFNQQLTIEKHFSKLCERVLQEKPSQATFDLRLPETSSELSSFPDDPLNVDIQEYLETGRQYEELNLGKDLQREESTIMTKPRQKNTD